jgi:hypothetical protein
VTAGVRAALGPNLAALLPEPAQQADVLAVFGRIADVDGPDVARAWLVGMNPLLDDRAPLTVIRDGGTPAVLAAANAYLT